MLLAGRSANWLAVSVSMYLSFFSSIIFWERLAMRLPAQLAIRIWLMMPVAAIVAGYLFVEFFYRLRIFTVFQYGDAFRYVSA